MTALFRILDSLSFNQLIIAALQFAWSGGESFGFLPSANWWGEQKAHGETRQSPRLPASRGPFDFAQGQARLHSRRTRPLIRSIISNAAPMTIPLSATLNAGQ